MAYNSCCGGNSKISPTQTSILSSTLLTPIAKYLSFPTDISNLILHRYTLDIPYSVSQAALLTITHKKVLPPLTQFLKLRIRVILDKDQHPFFLFIVPYLFNSNKLEIYFTCPISAAALNSYYDVDAFLPFSFPKSFSIQQLNQYLKFLFKRISSIWEECINTNNCYKKDILNKWIKMKEIYGDYLSRMVRKCTLSL